jgi:hypothetical protein
MMISKRHLYVSLGPFLILHMALFHAFEFRAAEPEEEGCIQQPS